MCLKYCSCAIFMFSNLSGPYGTIERPTSFYIEIFVCLGEKAFGVRS